METATNNLEINNLTKTKFRWFGYRENNLNANPVMNGHCSLGALIEE